MNHVTTTKTMKSLTSAPSEKERQLAHETYDALTEVLKKLKCDHADFTIKETKQTVEISVAAIKLLQEVVKQISKGNAVNIVPIAAEVSTQTAADILGVSRPYVVKILEKGEIPFTKAGRHRRIKFNDVMKHKRKMIDQQREALDEMVSLSQEYGLYD